MCEAFSKSSTFPRGSSTQGDPRPPMRGQHHLAAGDLGVERCRPGRSAVQEVCSRAELGEGAGGRQCKRRGRSSGLTWVSHGVFKE